MKKICIEITIRWVRGKNDIKGKIRWNETGKVRWDRWMEWWLEFSCKHAIMCQNGTRIVSMLTASGQFWSSFVISWYVFKVVHLLFAQCNGDVCVLVTWVIPDPDSTFFACMAHSVYLNWFWFPINKTTHRLVISVQMWVEIMQQLIWCETYDKTYDPIPVSINCELTMPYFMYQILHLIVS